MEASDPQYNRLAILLLDDSAPVRALLAELLEDFPFVERIVQAENVSSALAAFDRSFFDIAILDLNVPGEADIRNGIDLARVLKARYPSTKIVLLTAMANAVDQNASIDAGADRFYDKGQVDNLLDWIKESAGKNRGLR
jgi:CheY-like chemotaxis protein